MVFVNEDKRKLGRDMHKVRMWEKTEHCQVRRVLGGANWAWPKLRL